MSDDTTTNTNRRVLPFGAFLVDRGIISPAELEAVLVLQEERHPKLGSLARRHHLLTFENICAIIEHQRTHSMRFGEAAVALGLLNDQEVAALLEEQTNNHRLLGELLVELNIMNRSKLQACLAQYYVACQPVAVEGE